MLESKPSRPSTVSMHAFIQCTRLYFPHFWQFIFFMMMFTASLECSVPRNKPPVHGRMPSLQPKSSKWPSTLLQDSLYLQEVVHFLSDTAPIQITMYALEFIKPCMSEERSHESCSNAHLSKPWYSESSEAIFYSLATSSDLEPRREPTYRDM